MLPSWMLGGMRDMATRDFLTQTCVVQTRTNSRDALGAKTGSWSTVMADVPCRMIKPPGSLATMFTEENALRLEDTYRLALPARDSTYDFDLTPQTRFLVDDVPFEVISIEDALTDQVTRHVLVRRIRRGA